MMNPSRLIGQHIHSTRGLETNALLGRQGNTVPVRLSD